MLGGGASSAAAAAEDVTLHATLGQPVTGAVTSGDGNVSLGQGFWHGGAAAAGEDDRKVYLSLVLRNC